MEAAPEEGEGLGARGVYEVSCGATVWGIWVGYYVEDSAGYEGCQEGAFWGGGAWGLVEVGGFGFWNFHGLFDVRF